MEDILKIFGGSFVAGIIITALLHFWKQNGFKIINIIKNSFGALFIFSASVKAIDPLGTAYKMGEYFEAFHTEFMVDYALPFSVIMILLEFLLAIALIVAWNKKFTLYALFAMNIFFLMLTGYTYLTGHVPAGVGFFEFGNWTEWVETNMKVTDCGCFGDFIKQTPFEAFIKDWIIIALLIIIYLGKNKIKPLFNDQKSLKIITGLAILFLIFNFSNFYFDKPIVDFRPYAVGEDINAQRIEIADKLDYGFVFENKTTAETKRVDMANYSKFKADETWEFTGEQDNIILEKGIPAKIANYAAFNREGYDMTDEFLSYEGYSIWILSKRIDETNEDAWEDIVSLQPFFEQKQIYAYAFSSSVYKETDLFVAKHNIKIPFYEADDVFIKTVIRANPGMLLLKDGVVVAKWHHRHIPSVEDLKSLIK